VRDERFFDVRAVLDRLRSVKFRKRVVFRPIWKQFDELREILDHVGQTSHLEYFQRIRLQMLDFDGAVLVSGGVGGRNAAELGIRKAKHERAGPF